VLVRLPDFRQVESFWEHSPHFIRALYISPWSLT
jgi:hypothetical protein